jgi:hypothetical protein
MEITLVIAMDDKGQVSVTGPLENRMLCYGLLGMAREVIQQQGAKEPSRILKPMLLPAGRGPSPT